MSLPPDIGGPARCTGDGTARLSQQRGPQEQGTSGLVPLAPAVGLCPRLGLPRGPVPAGRAARLARYWASNKLPTGAVSLNKIKSKSNGLPEILAHLNPTFEISSSSKAN